MTTRKAEPLRQIVDQMLDLVEPDRFRIDGDKQAFTVAVGETSIAFDSRTGLVNHSLEQLAAAIEGYIAYDRACAMLAATDATDGPLPLWLVTGSSVLAAWLAWSGTEQVFRRRLVLSDHRNLGPVHGLLDRRTRHALGQTAVKIRVRNGLAVAERVELPGRPRCIVIMGREVRIRIEGNPLPDTLIAALANPDDKPSSISLATVVDERFIKAAGPRHVAANPRHRKRLHVCLLQPHSRVQTA